MIDIGKILLGFGVLLAVIGIALMGLAKLGFKGLPGDVHYQSQHVRIYFPIVSCVALSLLLTLLMWLWQWLRK